MNLCSGRPHHGLALAVLFCLGCDGPTIKQFDVQPHLLCPEGQKAVMQWRADGDLTMTFQLEKPQAGEEECAVEGFDTYKLTLVARKNKEEATRYVEIRQIRRNAAEPIVLTTTSRVDSDAVASGEKGSTRWGDSVVVDKVAACFRRRICVQHEGKSDCLAADGTPSAAFDGTALRGIWELRSLLTPEELQTPALFPKTLQIIATLRC